MGHKKKHTQINVCSWLESLTKHGTRSLKQHTPHTRFSLTDSKTYAVKAPWENQGTAKEYSITWHRQTSCISTLHRAPCAKWFHKLFISLAQCVLGFTLKGIKQVVLGEKMIVFNYFLQEKDHQVWDLHVINFMRLAQLKKWDGKWEGDGDKKSWFFSPDDKKKLFDCHKTVLIDREWCF